MSWQSAHFIFSQSFIDASLTLWLPVVVKTEILKKIIILFCGIKKLNYHQRSFFYGSVVSIYTHIRVRKAEIWKNMYFFIT